MYASLFLVHAPADVHRAQHAAGAVETEPRRVLDLDLLRPDAVLRLHARDRAHQEARDVDRVRGVVEQHAAAAIALTAFQRPRMSTRLQNAFSKNTGVR